MNKSRTEPKMKSRMLLSPFLKIGSWKKMFLCGKKSLEKPALKLPVEKIESEVLPTLDSTLELPHEIIESEVLPRLHSTLELPHEIIESEVLPRRHATAELPREIIEWEILPRLPLKYLAQFMRVCKQWRSLISSCEFTRKNLHYQKNKQSLTHLRVLEINYLSQTFTTRDCDDLNSHDSTTTHSIPFINGAQEVLLLASLDGLVFVELPNTCESAFWNPLTGAYKKLSNSPNFYSSYGAFGFYFDSYKKDYKVLQVNCFGPFKAFIYSHRLDSRKNVQWLEHHQGLSNSFWSTPITLGESLYFLGIHYNVTRGYQYWIIVFDVKSEKFREIHFPLPDQETPFYSGSLMVIKGCIHIFVTSCTKCDGELWRMDGDGAGWTKVKDFPPALMYDEKIDIQHLLRNFNLMEHRRKMLYLETLVSPSG